MLARSLYLVAELFLAKVYGRINSLPPELSCKTLRVWRL